MSISLRRRASIGSLLALALLAAGCSSSPSTTTTTDSQVGSGTADAALVEVVEQSQGQIPGLIETFAGVYSDIRILAEAPSTLVYEYDYTEAVDPEVAADHFETQRDLLNEACTAQIYPGLASAGVENPAVRYAYFNPDGTELWSMTCDPA